MSSPVWRISGSMKPRVVTAGEPTRSPLATLNEPSSKGNHVAVGGDVHRLEELLALEAVETGGTQVQQRQVDVGAARDETQAAVGQRLGQGGTVGDDLTLQAVELVGGGDLEAGGLGGHDVHQRSTLHPGTRPVDRPGELLTAHDDAGPRPVRVLCVVLVTTSQQGTGLGCRPAAISPAMWAMSASTMAPASSAIVRKAAKSTTRGYEL